MVFAHHPTFTAALTIHLSCLILSRYLMWCNPWFTQFFYNQVLIGCKRTHFQTVRMGKESFIFFYSDTFQTQDCAFLYSGHSRNSLCDYISIHILKGLDIYPRTGLSRLYLECAVLMKESSQMHPLSPVSLSLPVPCRYKSSIL